MSRSVSAADSYVPASHEPTITLAEPPAKAQGSTVTAARLQVSGLSVRSPQAHGIDLKDIALEVRGGEVLGIAGVAGNGQAELLAALSGELLADRPGAIVLEGKHVGQLFKRLEAQAAQRGEFVASGLLGQPLDARAFGDHDQIAGCIAIQHARQLQQ